MFSTIFSTSNVPLLCVVLFFAGLLEDLVDTWATFTVVKRQSFLSATLTFLSIFLEYTVFISIVSNLDKWYVISLYALGSGIGGFGVIEYQKRKTRKKKEQQKLKKIIGARKKKLEKLHAERKVKTVVSKPEIVSGVTLEKKITERKSEVKPSEKVQHIIKKEIPQVEKMTEKCESEVQKKSTVEKTVKEST